MTFLGVLVLAAGDGEEGKKKEKTTKKRVEEEESDDPKAKKTVKEEDEGGMKKKVVRVAEEDESATMPIEGGDLTKAAKEASHRSVKELFLELAEPADKVSLKSFAGVTVGGGSKLSGWVHVRPLPLYVSDPKEIKGEWELKVLAWPAATVQQTELASARTIQEVRYYERIAIAKVKAFIKEPLKHLQRLEQLQAAEQALSFVVRFHQSAREREVRKGDAWKEVEGEVRSALLDVLLERLSELTESKLFDEAFRLTRRLAETYTTLQDHNRLAKPLEVLLKKAVAEGFSQDKLKEVRKRLRQVEEQFPGSKLVEPISKSLRGQAEALFTSAKELYKERDKPEKVTEALALLRQAEDTWPELPGLRAFRIEIDKAYPILRVGMREFPRFFSPAKAATDADRRAVDLLFESLVNLLPDKQGVLSYYPSLSVGRPKVIPLGRELRLPHNARWSDDKPVTAADVRYTVRLLQEGAGTGRSIEWGSLLTETPVSDPFRARLLLRQGFLDPLSAMSFKILPQRTRPLANSEEFALNPITSGPFRLPPKGDRQGTEDGSRPFICFKANPLYVRGGDRPRMKEVRFFEPPNPVKALQDGQIALALDLTAEQVEALKPNSDFEVPLPTAESVNRRIYFLAVNHRRPPLDNAELRLALALAINREALLNTHFRKGLKRKVHRSLNGPYPAGSWACNPALVSRLDKTVLDPFDPDRARLKLKGAMAKLGGVPIALKLKYPTGDKQLAAALTELCTKVSNELQSVTLTPDPVEPQDLHESVEMTPYSYDLAYCSYDFPDETFWLLPLLGADNYLGYNGPLVAKIQASMVLRHFTQVRDFARAIHAQMLDSEMPFIPLWQLTPLYAYRKNRLTLPPVDANHIFAQVEDWRVTPERAKE
jgi:ABC-type transport system substrate-binding protein